MGYRDAFDGTNESRRDDDDVADVFGSDRASVKPEYPPPIGSPADLAARAGPASRAEAPIGRGDLRPIGRIDLDRLTAGYLAVAFHGWKSATLLLLAGMLVSFVLFGLFWSYWLVADQDLILAYQGLLFNDGLPQEYFDHTGYLYVLAIGEWYRLLHAVGILHVDALSELPPARDVAAFDAAWQQLIEAGRCLSLIFGWLFVWSFATLTRQLIGDWRIANLCAVALAFSGGIAMHIRVMRTELMSSALVTTALLLVLIAARRPRFASRFAMIAAAGLCAALAVVAKVHALFVVLAVPAIALAFGVREGGAPARSGTPAAWLRAALWGIVALAAAIPAGALLRDGIEMIGSSIISYHPLGGGLSGRYQLLFGAWVIVLMTAYAGIWRVSVADTLAAMAALAFGLALGLLSLDIRYNPQNVIAVANPIEHMFTFAAASNTELDAAPEVLTGALTSTLINGLGMALAKHSFVFGTSHRPTLLLEWLAIAGTIVAWRRGDRLLPLQVAILILAAWGIDAVSALRGLKLAYFAYTDPLLIVAAGLVAVRFPELQTSLRAQKIMLGLFTFYLLWGHAVPVQTTLSRKTAGEWCFFFPVHVRRVEFPFCGT